MRQLVAVLLIAVLAGCGVETASTAVTAAAVKKKEMEEGKKTMEQTKQKIDEAMQQTQQRAEKDGER